MLHFEEQVDTLLQGLPLLELLNGLKVERELILGNPIGEVPLLLSTPSGSDLAGRLRKLSRTIVKEEPSMEDREDDSINNSHILKSSRLFSHEDLLLESQRNILLSDQNIVEDS